MTLESVFIFAVSLAILWIKPGPGQAAIVTRSLNDGFFAGFCVAAGIVTGTMVYFLITTMSMSVISEFADIISFIFKILGAGYLFYIAYCGFKDIESGRWQKQKTKSHSKESLKNYLTGLLITLANPFVVFYFIGIVPTLIPLVDLTTNDLIICTVTIFCVGLVIDTLIAALAWQVRETLQDTQFIKRINIITSLGFIVIGTFLLLSALLNYDGAFAVL